MKETITEMIRRIVKEELSTSDKNQLRVLIDTIKNPSKGMFLGGPTEAEAIRILKTKFKYTDTQIAALKK